MAGHVVCLALAFTWLLAALPEDWVVGRAECSDWLLADPDRSRSSQIVRRLIRLDSGNE